MHTSEATNGLSLFLDVRPEYAAGFVGFALRKAAGAVEVGAGREEEQRVGYKEGTISLGGRAGSSSKGEGRG